MVFRKPTAHLLYSGNVCANQRKYLSSLPMLGVFPTAKGLANSDWRQPLLIHVVAAGSQYSRASVLRKFQSAFVKALLTGLKVVSQQKWTGLELVMGSIIAAQACHGLFQEAIVRTLSQKAAVLNPLDRYHAEISEQASIAKSWVNSPLFLPRRRQGFTHQPQTAILSI